MFSFRCGYVAALAFLFVLCSLGTDVSAQKFGKVTNEEWMIARPADFPEANAVVVFDRCSLYVALSGITIERHVRMKVFNKAGADEIGDVHVYYEDGDKVKDLKAQTILSNGQTVKVDGKAFLTKTAGSSRFKTFAFPAMDSGCIVEYKYTNINTHFGYLQPWYFQSNLYVIKSQFTLILDPGFTYSSSFSRALGGSREAVEGELPYLDDPRLKLKTYTWTQENLPPVTDEPFMGVKENYYASLHYQLVSYQGPGGKYNFIRNWGDIGDELQNFLGNYMSGGGIDDLSARLTTGASTQTEKLRKLYDYASDSIKFASDLDYRWFANDNVGKLLKAGYGTSTEKTALLLALAKKAGIPAQPMFISTREHSMFDPLICQAQQLNHLIIFAQPDSTTMLMDAMSRYCPYSMLPAQCLVEAGLLIDGKDSRPIKVRRNDPRTYRLDATELAIDSAGVAKCSTTCTLTGYFAPQYGELSEQHKPDEFIKEHFLDKVDQQATLDTESLALDSSGQFVIAARYSLPNAVRSLDNNLVVKMPIFYLHENPFKRQKRSFPVDFNFPFTYQNVVRISSERKISSSSLPADVSLAIDGITYERKSAVQDGEVVIDSKLKVMQPVFEPSRYPQVREFFEKVGQAQAEELALTVE